MGRQDTKLGGRNLTEVRRDSDGALAGLEKPVAPLSQAQQLEVAQRELAHEGLATVPDPHSPLHDARFTRPRDKGTDEK